LGHTWYIGVYGYQLCNYQIMETIQPNCPYNCHGHGVCVNQRCECVEEWVGESCFYPLQVFAGISSIASGSISSNFWNYYKFTIDPSVQITSITVSVKEIASTGFINVYLQRGYLPTLTDYIDSDTNQSTNVHSVYSILNSDPNGNRDFYIGVYGTNFIPLDSSFPYKIGVYSPKITFN